MVIPTDTSAQQAITAQNTGSPTTPAWDQVAGQFGKDPGRVFLENFDLGVVKTLGAFLDPSAPVDEPSYIMYVPNLKPEAERETVEGDVVVPVTFAHPESYMSIWKLPGVFVRRDRVEPDLQRYSQELEGFRLPAPNTQIETIETPYGDITGPVEVYSRARPEAYNFYYVIDMIARWRTDANALLRAILPRFKQHKAIIVQDDLGDYNEYSAFLESIDTLDEIIGVTMKHHGFSLTIRVVGELDMAENDVRPTAKNVELGVFPKDPLEVEPIVTNSDGNPLKTGPADYLGSICSHVKRKPLNYFPFRPWAIPTPRTTVPQVQRPPLPT